MFNGLYRACRLPACAVVVLTLLAALGCTGSGGDGSNTILGQLANTVRRNTLMIRVVNETTSSLEATIRVDGETKYLPACSSTQRVCDFVLAECPSMVELIEENRHDPFTDAFMGGRNFEGNPSFIFTAGEFQCDDMLIFQFSETDASAQAM